MASTAFKSAVVKVSSVSALSGSSSKHQNKHVKYKADVEKGEVSQNV